MTAAQVHSAPPECAAKLRAPPTCQPRMCILAAKNLAYNTRVCRQAQALAADGWAVTVAALELPVAELRERAPEVDYVRVDLPHPLQALARLRGLARRPPVGTPSQLVDQADARARLLRLARWLIQPWSEVVIRVLFAWRCLRLFRHHAFDVVQAHDAAPLPAAAALARRHSARWLYDALEFVDDRGGLPRGVAGRLVRRCTAAWETRLIRRADHVFAIGTGMQQWMVGRYRIAPPTVVRNCREFVADPRNDRLRDTLGLAAATPLVLCANSIVPGEGLEQFIAALARLPGSVHGVVLGPARDATYRDRLRALAAAAGVGGRLHFPPPCRPDEVIELFAGADLGVIPRQNTGRNHYLSLPNRLFEMVMARLPVLASRFPDLSAVIEHYDIGTTFDETDPASIADAIVAALSPDSRARYSERLERAAHSLCWERESRVYRDVLRALAGRAAAA